MSVKSRLFLGFIGLVTVFQAGLGFWQWQRRSEKAAFIAALSRAIESPAEPYRATTPAWRRVTLEGRYLNQHAAYVRTSRPAPKSGARGEMPTSGFGVFVMVPFVYRDCAADGACRLANVYVNRGFLPTPPDGRLPAHARPDEPVTITGIVRPAEVPGLFQPGNDPARKVWFHRSVAEMAWMAGLPAAQDAKAAEAAFPIFIDREAGPSEAAPPFGLEAKALLATIPDNHLQYALTWWGLALTNVVALGVFLRSRRRGVPNGR